MGPDKKKDPPDPAAPTEVPLEVPVTPVQEPGIHRRSAPSIEEPSAPPAHEPERKEPGDDPPEPVKG